jgi:hypothetical protein
MLFCNLCFWTVYWHQGCLHRRKGSFVWPVSQKPGVLLDTPRHHTSSKACLTSRKTDVQYSLFSNAWCSLCVILCICCTVEWFFLKPNWCDCIHSSVFGSGLILFSRSFSRSLEAMGNRTRTTNTYKFHSWNWNTTDCERIICTEILVHGCKIRGYCTYC